jgi:MerR family transcriptional regulator, thiopeptide resistance regulator
VAVVSDDEPLIQIGELAAAVGLTVRTLHHYDDIGLLVPAQRSQSGRRLYSPQGVRRLYRIVALRRLGLGLAEIGSLLDASPDLAQAVRGHLEQVEAQLELGRRLRVTLTRILELLDSGHDPGRDEFIDAIGVMIMSESYYTAEQQEQLAERRRALGEEGMAGAERAWAERMYREQGAQTASRGMVDPELMQYVGQAMAQLD